MVIGRGLRDTQTGLRGIPRAFLRELIPLEAGRYEFELDMLVRATEQGVPIEELTIQTVYGGAGQSHFSPLRDSLRIYFVFVRFVSLSLITAALDFVVFTIAYRASHNIFAATVIGRILGGAFNFSVNRALVFRSRGGVVGELIKYASLVGVLMGVSYGLVTSLVIFVGLTVYVAKLIAETTLFAASFALQNLVVFGERRAAPVATTGRTDWDAYYRQPGVFTPLTRRATRRAILADATSVGGDHFAHIVELGGGNSAMLAAMRERFPDARLTAVDSNTLGLDLLRTRFAGDARLDIVRADVLAPFSGAADADFVFSVGLIEHFDPGGTAGAVRAHFDRVTPGGLVLVTFPTPTWLYRLVRGAAETLGVWAFPDERPLAVDDVVAEVAKHGDVLRVRINWPVILTQAIVVARRPLRELAKENQ
jgi:putative flippase GtrA